MREVRGIYSFDFDLDELSLEDIEELDAVDTQLKIIANMAVKGSYKNNFYKFLEEFAPSPR